MPTQREVSYGVEGTARMRDRFIAPCGGVDNFSGSVILYWSRRDGTRLDVDAILRELLWAISARVLSLRRLRILISSLTGVLLPVRIKISPFVLLPAEPL